MEICPDKQLLIFRSFLGAKKAELLRRSKDGDEGARRELIDGNLRLVLSVIQRFSNRHENMDDLFPGRLYRSDKGDRQFQP